MNNKKAICDHHVYFDCRSDFRVYCRCRQLPPVGLEFHQTETWGYFAYGSEVYAIDAKNGSLVWRYPAELQREIPNFLLHRQFLKTRFLRAVITTLWLLLDKSNGFEKWTFANAQRSLYCLTIGCGNHGVRTKYGQIFICIEYCRRSFMVI